MLRCNINFYCYTDDIQLYFPVKPGTIDVSFMTPSAFSSNNFLSGRLDANNVKKEAP